MRGGNYKRIMDMESGAVFHSLSMLAQYFIMMPDWKLKEQFKNKGVGEVVELGGRRYRILSNDEYKAWLDHKSLHEKRLSKPIDKPVFMQAYGDFNKEKPAGIYMLRRIDPGYAVHPAVLEDRAGNVIYARLDAIKRLEGPAYG